MPEIETTGKLTILSERAGTVAEVSQFLGDLESAYLSLYELNVAWSPPWPSRQVPSMFKLGFPYPLLGWAYGGRLTPELILPDYRLVIRRVRIESPGFWEFVGSLNALQQIREYLNDRHRRRQDREFREAAERDKLSLENKLIDRQILEKENSVLRERINILKDLGFSNEDIRQMVWATVGNPLAQLGKHQDSGLVGGAE